MIFGAFVFNIFSAYILLIISSIIIIISYLFHIYNIYKKKKKYSFNERTDFFLYSFIFFIVFNILYIITLKYGYIPKEKLLKNKDELKKIRKIIREKIKLKKNNMLHLKITFFYISLSVALFYTTLDKL